MESQPKKIFEALVLAQKGFRELLKTKEGYGYRYAPADEVWKAVKDSLHKHNLCAFHTLDHAENTTYLLTHLAHAGGEMITSKVAVPAGLQSKNLNTLQAFGSALTYLKRYSLCALLCIHSEEDMDGSIPEALAIQLKAKASHDSAYTEKTKGLLQKYGVSKISSLPKKAESAAREVLK